MKRAAAAALAILSLLFTGCELEPVRLGLIKEIRYAYDPRYVMIETRSGDIYQMRTATAQMYGCAQGMTLWETSTGRLYCQ